MTAVRFQKMGGTRLIAEAQLLVLMWCRIVDIGAHHACWLLLQALFITASVPTGDEHSRDEDNDQGALH